LIYVKPLIDFRQIFPNYDRGFCAHSTDANVDPFSEGGGDDSIIGNDDLLGLMELCQLNVRLVRSSIILLLAKLMARSDSGIRYLSNT
jgi:hypothetical protein